MKKIFSIYLVRLIKDNKKKIAIIVGDGVRYEVADSVASRISPDIKIDKKFMYAGLPSETEHNMSALYTTGGKIIATKSEREKVLSQETGKNITYMQLEEVNETTDGDILVLTYKDIDDAGEKMQQAMLKLRGSTISLSWPGLMVQMNCVDTVELI